MKKCFVNLLESIVERGRSSYPKEQERTRSLSSQAILDPTHSRLSKSNENITQSISQQHSMSTEPPRGERITKSEDRHLSNTNLNDQQIQRFNSLKEKFERQQPIDTLFGILKKSKKIFEKLIFLSSLQILVDIHLKFSHHILILSLTPMYTFSVCL
jgi:hypothetical protein